MGCPVKMNPNDTLLNGNIWATTSYFQPWIFAVKLQWLLHTLFLGAGIFLLASQTQFRWGCTKNSKSITYTNESNVTAQSYMTIGYIIVSNIHEWCRTVIHIQGWKNANSPRICMVIKHHQTWDLSIHGQVEANEEMWCFFTKVDEAIQFSYRLTTQWAVNIAFASASLFLKSVLNKRKQLLAYILFLLRVGPFACTY